MRNAGRRLRRLFYLLAGCMLAVSPAWTQSPALTTVSDTLLRADGTPAQGTLLISWPAFISADGRAIAAGNKSVVLAADGSFTVELAPNSGATPRGVVYTVVSQLHDSVKTEYWLVGTTSPETVAQVRTIVSLAGNAGGGNFVLKSGDTMTGPLTLPGSPTAPLQAATKQYVDMSAGGGSPPVQAIKYATDFNWSQTNAADLSSAGAKTVALASCPAGVSGTEAAYYIYIAGTGTPEAVLVTGGTCAGNGQPGTLQFTTANPHAAGYSLGSASEGIQEALVAARFTPQNPTGNSQSGKVIVPPGELKAFAKISIRASNLTVDFSGSIIECWMSAPCIFVGDSTSSTLFQNITLISPRGRPTVAGGVFPFIEVNAQKTRVYNVSTRIPYAGGTFGSYVQVDDDQAFLLDGLDTSVGGGLRCDSTVCSPAVYAPGPFNVYSAVGWLKNLNISNQCGGNGVDWESGNTLQISDSVIQGYAQYGVRTGIRRGGYGGTVLENVYEEVGNCGNPAGALGQAGVIAQGATIKIDGGAGPAGWMPQFANTGGTDYRYYIVAHHPTYGASNPLYAGRALTNGVGDIVVTTADIPGASTLDLLRVGVAGVEQAPYGTGEYAVASNVSRASACSNGICTFTDTQAPLQAYTVATPTYFPLIPYWPGSLILSAGADNGLGYSGARAWLQNMVSNIVSVSGTAQPSALSLNCDAVGGWTPIWMTCISAMAPATYYRQGALLLAVKPNADGNQMLNLKGRLNFLTLGTGPGHIVTLSDSNFQKTIATQNNRPDNDANDAFIGYDQGNGDPAQIGISFGAPKSLSNYIGNVGDGTNWLERLTTNLKEFKTSVKMDSGLTVVGSIQANSFTSTGAGPWSLQGSFGNLSPAAAGKSLIGFGANGKLEVSENGGPLQEVAKADSNGNVGTAIALAQAPTQCTGSFATGIQANGDANCSTADQIQLAETSAPSGIPNYGIFWFDATCHCPKVIANNGQPVQLGLTNVFNQDSNGINPANTLEQVNGTSAQTLRVYRTWSSPTDWERTGLAWDQTDGYFVLKNENSGSGSQRGIGFWIGSNVRWAIDTASNFKPFTDNSYSIGSTTLRPATGYFGTAVYAPALLLQGAVNSSGGPVNLNTQTAAIATTNLLSGATVGQYEVSVYLESDATCSTPGSAAVSVTLGWGDRTGARSMTVPLLGSGVTSGAVSLGSTANFGQAVVTVWNNSATNNLTYSTNYTGCTSGTGTYALYITYRRMQ